MARRPSEGPTDAELEILHVFWQQGPSTVRDVFDVLNRIRPTGYTTALKLLQIMAEKGLVRRDESHKTHVYEAVIPREHVQQTTVRSLVDRLFEGSCEKLLVQAFRAKKVSKKEINRIRELLDEYGRETK